MTSKMKGSTSNKTAKGRSLPADLAELARTVTHCHRCPRLIRHCTEVALRKKREFRDWDYWGKPVPGFGDPGARLWIVGLAPAAHGANRTGRMFTGDKSGEWLYSALYDHGFSTARESLSRDDGLQLNGVYISAAARCAPPQNKPLPAELTRCESYLDREWEALQQVRLILALGNIAYVSVRKLLARQQAPLPETVPKFAHGARFVAGPRTVLASYNPSRQNTQTGRLTRPLWNEIFATARDLTGGSRR